jgi:hypothetical protein
MLLMWLFNRFVWQDKKREWTPRKQKFAVGRVHFCGPKAGERYFLRLLLHHVKAAKSFEELRTVHGEQNPRPTFRDACLGYGLLESDEQWHNCLNEAALMEKGHGMRNLFAVILTESHPADPNELWEQHREDICDDCQFLLSTKFNIPSPSPEQVFSLGLCYLQQILKSLHSDLDKVGLPLPVEEFNLNTEGEGNRFIHEQLSFNVESMTRQVDSEVPQLNHLQRHAYESVLSAVTARQGQLFFLDGPGGTGKTFVENLLLSAVRSRGGIALAVASSGIAALLLNGGRTAHSMFSIPIQCDHNSICEVDKEGEKADLFRRVELIIWDEASMQHRHAYEAVDRMLRDVRSDLRAFGGITVLFAGDFRQCLPVVPGGSRAQIVAASLKRSVHWEHIRTLPLKENVRLLGGSLSSVERARAEEYAQYILRIGDGVETSTLEDYISLRPSILLEDNSLETLVSKVYPNLGPGLSLPEPDFLAERAILAARNVDVNFLNELLLDRLPGQEYEFQSIDSASSEDELTYSEEYLNSLDISGVPPHKLKLKVGAPIMLLRNINPMLGLCNGTRMQVTHLNRNIIGGQYFNSCECLANVV